MTRQQQAAERPRTVAHVTYSLGLGGLERMALDLCRGLDCRRYHGSSFTLSPTLDRAAAFAAAGVEVRLVRQRGLDVTLVPRLALAFRRARVDLVHAHNFSTFLYAGPAAKLAGIPALYTEHSNTDPAQRRLWRAQRPCSRLAGQVVAVSDAVRYRLITEQGLPARRVVTIPNGIDLAYHASADREPARAALGLAPEELVVGTVGRLVAVKNQQLLLDAFARLAGQVPQARLVIAGGGPLHDSLAGHAHRLGIADRLLLLGPREDVPNVLAAFDIFALSSHSEGLPLAVLEAMAAGLPVAATHVGGVPQVVVQGVTGALCPPDDPDALAADLLRLATQPQLRAQYGAAGRELAYREHSLEVMVRRYTEVYDRLLGLSAGAAPSSS